MRSNFTQIQRTQRLSEWKSMRWKGIKPVMLVSLSLLLPAFLLVFFTKNNMVNSHLITETSVEYHQRPWNYVSSRSSILVFALK